MRCRRSEIDNRQLAVDEQSPERTSHIEVATSLLTLLLI